jgi:hypothetical protein
VSGISGGPPPGLQVRFEQAVLAAAMDQLRQDEAHMEAQYLALSVMDQAVLWRLLEQQGSLRAYDADTLRFYSSKVGKKVIAAQAQASLDRWCGNLPAASMLSRTSPCIDGSATGLPTADGHRVVKRSMVDERPRSRQKPLTQFDLATWPRLNVRREAQVKVVRSSSNNKRM